MFLPTAMNEGERYFLPCERDTFGMQNGRLVFSDTASTYSEVSSIGSYRGEQRAFSPCSTSSTRSLKTIAIPQPPLGFIARTPTDMSSFYLGNDRKQVWIAFWAPGTVHGWGYAPIPNPICYGPCCAPYDDNLNNGIPKSTKTVSCDPKYPFCAEDEFVCEKRPSGKLFLVNRMGDAIYVIVEKTPIPRLRECKKTRAQQKRVASVTHLRIHGIPTHKWENPLDAKYFGRGPEMDKRVIADSVISKMKKFFKNKGITKEAKARFKNKGYQTFYVPICERMPMEGLEESAYEVERKRNPDSGEMEPVLNEDGTFKLKERICIQNYFDMEFKAKGKLEDSGRNIPGFDGPVSDDVIRADFYKQKLSSFTIDGLRYVDTVTETVQRKLLNLKVYPLVELIPNWEQKKTDKKSR